MTISWSNTLTASLGTETVVAQDGLGDYSIEGFIPEVAVFPADVEAVSGVLAFAVREGKKVVPWGGGTQMALGNTPRGVDVVLGLGRLDRHLSHEPADLVATVEAGTTLKMLQGELAIEGQTLPLEAPLPSRATIGGILAADASGPSRLAYGTPRDWLIGIKVVQSDGSVTKSGGRVVKNVTGYDLNKLYTGSLGTLGVIVEATFKVAPLPPEKRTLLAIYPSISAAMEVAGELLRQSFVPQALEVINSDIMGRMPGLATTTGDAAALLALIAGRRVAVERKVDELSRVMGRGSSRSVERLSQGEGDVLWQAVTDLGWGEEGLPDLAVKVNILPDQVEDFLAMAGPLGGQPFSQGMVADVGSGVVRHLWWSDEGNSGTGLFVEKMISEYREWARRHNGHVVVERCPQEVKGNIDVWGDSLEGMAIMRRIKKELDPAGVLNPGRFAGRI